VLDELKIHKVALVVFKRNAEGNKFWEKLGFSVREDFIYRNQARTEMVRLDI
ncbi:GNAT family N-acetyltransferase, partial [Klebsiella pneumoniae]